MSAGAFPALLALTHATTPIGYGLGAATGILLFAVFRLCWSGALLLKATAIARERVSSDSSPFDPLDQVYRDKRLFLRDLAPMGRKSVSGRRFINCEIIGPGNLVLSLRSSEHVPWPDIRNNTFHDVDFIQIAPGCKPLNAILFPDCHFDGCNLYNLNLLFYDRMREDWNWITNATAQLQLPEPNHDKLDE